MHVPLWGVWLGLAMAGQLRMRAAMAGHERGGQVRMGRPLSAATP